MPYPPNKQVENFTVFNGGTAGATVSPGQYALDWLRSLGGDATTPDGAALIVSMPHQPDGTPGPIPDALAAMLTNDRHGVLAAIAGKVYPPGSNQPPKPVAPYYP